MKHQKKSIKKLNKDSISLFNHVKKSENLSLNEKNDSLQESLIKCEKAYDMYLASEEKFAETQFKLEFNLAVLYLLSNKNSKCLYYLDKVKKNGLSKAFNEKKNRQLGYLYLKLANNYKRETNDIDKILMLYKYAAEYFEKINYYDKEDDGNDEHDFVIYCQILITIAKYLSIKQLIDEAFIDKVISVCKSLEDEEIKAKIFSDLSTIIIRMDKNINNFHKAESLLKKSQNLVNENNVYLKAIIYHNLGALYNRYSDYKKAIQNINKALDFIDKDTEFDEPEKMEAFRQQISDIYFNLGYAHAKLREIDDAKNAFNNSLTYLGQTETTKNKWESLAALGTLCALNSEEENAINFFQEAITVHQAYEIKDEVYIQIEKSLTNKIESLKKRIQLNNSFKMLNNDTALDTTDFIYDDENDLKTGTHIYSSLKSDMGSSKKTTTKKGILKTDDDKKRPAIFRKLSERKSAKTVTINDEKVKPSSDTEPIYATIDSTLPNTNNLILDMDLTTQKASGEFLQPVNKKKSNDSDNNSASALSSDDENNEDTKKEQKKLMDDYIKNISEYENEMEKKEKDNSNDNKKENQVLVAKNPTPRKKIDVDVIEKVVDNSQFNKPKLEQQPKKSKSKICAIM